MMTVGYNTVVAVATPTTAHVAVAMTVAVMVAIITVVDSAIRQCFRVALSDEAIEHHHRRVHVLLFPRYTKR